MTTTRKPFRFRLLAGLAAPLALTLATAENSQAANQTWDAGGDKTSWFDGDNWVGGASPGANSGTGNTDTAYFDSTPSGGLTIGVGSYLNIKQFHFQNGAGAYTINADAGGAIYINGNTGGASSGFFTANDRADANAPITINAPLVFESSAAANGTYTVNVRNDANASTSPILVTGDITTASSAWNKTFVLSLSAQNNGHVNEVSGDISDGLATGGIHVNKADNGLWVISGNNTYSGGTKISSGTLAIHSNTALGTGTFEIANGTVIRNFSGSAVTLTNNNAIVLSGNFNSQLDNDLNLGTGNVTLTTNITVRSQLSVAGTKLTIGGDISDGGSGYGISRATDANGELILNGKRTYGGATSISAGILTLGGESTSAGGTTVATGRLNLNHAKALGSGSLTITSGTLGNTSGAAVTITTTNAQTWNGNFTFAGSDDLDLGNGAVSLGTTAGTARTVTVTANTLSVGGVISDGTTANALTKAGAGTLVLYGNNQYTGATTVSAGTLLINGDHTNAGAYSVSNGATLGGHGSITTASNAGVTLAAGSKLAPGSLNEAETLAFDLGTGTLNISATVNGSNSQSLLFTLGSTSDKILLTNASSSLSIGTGKLEFDDFVFSAGPGFGGGTYTLFETGSTISGTLGTNLTGQVNGLDAELSFANSSQNIILTVVPEPTAGTLLVLAGLGVLAARRKCGAD